MVKSASAAHIATPAAENAAQKNKFKLGQQLSELKLFNIFNCIKSFFADYMLNSASILIRNIIRHAELH